MLLFISMLSIAKFKPDIIWTFDRLTDKGKDGQSGLWKQLILL